MSESLQFRFDIPSNSQGIAARQGKDQNTYCIFAPKAEERVVVFCSEFRPTDIFQLDKRTIRRGLDYQFLKLGNVCESANSSEVKLIHLPIYGWLLTDSPSTYLKVLFLNGIKYVSSSKVATS